MSTDQQATIAVQLHRQRAHVSEALFGLHLEHIWNCVYPCVWVGSDSPMPNTKGIRSDTTALLSELHPTVCKYPGGYFSDFYDWRDGIGPREQRPAREYPCAPGRVESNAFGTAEFVEFCRQIGAEPYISVNTTSIQPSDAAHWVEYCNGTLDTYWANRRRQHGYERPFNVRYWAIGNEPYWLHTPEAYAERYRHWVHWMYNADPAITVVAGGISPEYEADGLCNVDGRWGERFLKATQACRWWRTGWHPSAEENQVLYSLHPYFSANADCTREEYFRAIAELHARLPRAIATTVAQLDETRGNAPRPKLCFDEYGLIHPGCRMDGNMTQPAPFWAALWLGQFFHICFEHADAVGMATHPGPINMEHELLLLEEGRVVKTPSFHVFRMFRDHGGCDAVACNLSDAPVCEPLQRPGLSCFATVKPNGGEMTLSVINLDLERDTTAQIAVAGGRIESAAAEVLVCDDLHATNSATHPDRVEPVASPVNISDNKIEHTFLKQSATVFQIVLT